MGAQGHGEGGVNSFYKNIMRSFTGEFDKSESLSKVVMTGHWHGPWSLVPGPRITDF